MKAKEIKFRRVGLHSLEGRQNNIIYQIYWRRCDGDLAYVVSIHNLKDPNKNISTQNHQQFTLESAKKFCQDVAAGRVDLEALRKEYDERRQSLKAQATERARQEARTFQHSLSATGITFSAFLALVEQFDQLDSTARSFIDG